MCELLILNVKNIHALNHILVLLIMWCVYITNSLAEEGFDPRLAEQPRGP